MERHQIPPSSHLLCTAKRKKLYTLHVTWNQRCSEYRSRAYFYIVTNSNTNVLLDIIASILTFSLLVSFSARGQRLGATPTQVWIAVNIVDPVPIDLPVTACNMHVACNTVQYMYGSLCTFTLSRFVSNWAYLVLFDGVLGVLLSSQRAFWCL